MVCISWFTGSSVHPVVQSWSTQYHEVHSTMQLGRLGMREFSNQLCLVHDKRIHELPSVKVHGTTLYNSGWNGRAQVSLVPRSSLGLGMRLGSRS